MTTILGLNLSHNTSACLVREGNILAAVSEERLSRIKNEPGFPRRAIAEVMRIAALAPDGIDHVSVSYHRHMDMYTECAALQDLSHHAGIADRCYRWLLFHVPLIIVAHFLVIKYLSGLRQWVHRRTLAAIGRRLRHEFNVRAPLQYEEHHLCHATAAWFYSGTPAPLVVTSDGLGDGIAGAISCVEQHTLRRLATAPMVSSVGLMYQNITHSLGFKRLQHEGKITGLAAYADYTKTMPLFERFIRLSAASRSFELTIPREFIPTPRSWEFWKSLPIQFPQAHLHLAAERYAAAICRQCSREEAAAGVQHQAEQLLCQWTAAVIPTLPGGFSGDLALNGGVFANVKINQRMSELSGVKNIFIFPAMDDTGNAVGAALCTQQRLHPLPPRRINDMFLGPDYAATEIAQALQQAGLAYKHYDNIEQIVAELLAIQRIVARFNGRMEFGPRALGNRSMLYHAGDASVNQWLNTQLKRSEFMPFAPAVLAEAAAQCFENSIPAQYAGQFMTITLNCTDYFRRACPAAVHIDNTARPQFVTAQNNPSFYKILQHYHTLTGIPAVINTSFNMHEEPIVCTPADAITGFLQSNIHYLAIGPLLAGRADMALP